MSDGDWEAVADIMSMFGVVVIFALGISTCGGQ